MCVIFAVWVALGHLYHGCIVSIPRDCLTQTYVCVWLCVSEQGCGDLESAICITKNEDEDRYKVRINKGQRHRGGRGKKNGSGKGRKRDKSRRSWRRGEKCESCEKSNE